jgi:carbon monoxide dehydrogenase subunit G
MFAPLRRIWDAFDDPVILAACVPENDDLIQSATHTFTAKARIKLGPVSTRITVDIHIEPNDPPRHAIVYLDAYGAMGQAKATVHLTLTEGTTCTQLDYSALIQFSGRAGRLAGRFGEEAAKDLVRAFFTRLAHAIPRQQDIAEAHAAEAQTEPVKPAKRTLPWAEEPRWRKNAAWIGGGAAALATVAAVLWSRRRS